MTSEELVRFADKRRTRKKSLVEPALRVPYWISRCLTRSSAPSIGVSIRSMVRNAARLAVYDEMMMRVKNHQALPTIRPDNDLSTGMTNYRIDRIGTHRHASAPNLTTSTRQNRGRGIKVQFQGVNIGQTGGKVSKQMDSCI